VALTLPPPSASPGQGGEACGVSVACQRGHMPPQPKGPQVRLLEVCSLFVCQSLPHVGVLFVWTVVLGGFDGLPRTIHNDFDVGGCNRTPTLHSRGFTFCLPPQVALSPEDPGGGRLQYPQGPEVAFECWVLFQGREPLAFSLSLSVCCVSLPRPCIDLT